MLYDGHFLGLPAAVKKPERLSPFFPSCGLFYSIPLPCEVFFKNLKWCDCDWHYCRKIWRQSLLTTNLFLPSFALLVGLCLKGVKTAKAHRQTFSESL